MAKTTDPTAEPPIIWRTKLRSLKEGVEHTRQVAHCFDHGVVGIGWGIERLRSGASLSAVLKAIEAVEEKGWGRQAASTVRLFGEEAKVGDFIWTRDLQGRFRLARIAGDYRYENTAAAKAIDTHQVRDVKWAKAPLGDLEVPGAVVRAFSGTSTSFSRIWDTSARIYTAWKWQELNGRRPAPLKWTAAEVLHQLGPYDLEDLIYTWMQVHEDCLALPKARRTDTPAYEWTMLSRRNHRPAIVQIKSGEQYVDLEALAKAAPDRNTTVYAFSAAGDYRGKPSRRVIRIPTKALVDFAVGNPKLLPPRVRTWFELAKPG